MTMTPHLLATESPTNELAMLLVGDKKSGKSQLAATAPGNKLFLEFDQRLAALRTHPNVKDIYGMSFADSSNTNLIPTAFNEMLDILNRLEKSPRLRDLHTMFAACGDKLVDTIVFDSVQTMADAARRYVLYTSPDVGKAIVMGQKTYRVAKTFHAWGGEMEMVTGAILQARALLHCKLCLESVTWFKNSATGMGELRHTAELPPQLGQPGPLPGAVAKKYDHQPEPRAMNVIAILHECIEEDERSTQETPIYTGKIEVYPRRYNTLLVYFNEVWRLTRQGRVPTVTCDPDGKFMQAATALGIAKVETPNIEVTLRLVNGQGRK
jgi:hypothetical protein